MADLQGKWPSTAIAVNRHRKKHLTHLPAFQRRGGPDVNGHPACRSSLVSLWWRLFWDVFRPLHQRKIPLLVAFFGHCGRNGAIYRLPIDRPLTSSSGIVSLTTKLNQI
jgi:hypothetical protein